MTQFFGPLTGWALARRAWKSTGAAFRAHPVMFLATMALGAGRGVVEARPPFNAWLWRPLAADTTVHSGLIYSGATLLSLLLATAIVTPLAVGVHRFILREEVQGGFFAAVRNYFYWTLGLQAVFWAAFTYSLLASGVGFVRGLIDGIIAIAVAVVTRRLLVLFPAVAVGVPSRSAEARIETSWQQMQGNLWLAVRAVLFTLVPLLVLIFVLQKLGLPKPPAIPPISPPKPAPPPVTMLLMIGRGLLGAVNALLVAATAAVASWLYAATRRS